MARRGFWFMFKVMPVFNTLKAEMVVGVNPGYQDNAKEVDIKQFAELYKRCAETIMEKHGVYVSAVAHAVRTLYKTEWGCPEGGEPCVRIEADCNPSYSEMPPAKYKEKWKECVMEIIKELMKELGQKTVTLSFSDGGVFYIQQE